MNFVFVVSGLAFSRLHTSNPYIFGRLTSIITRKGNSFMILTIASMPSEAVTVWYSFFDSNAWISFTTWGLECATSTLLLSGGFFCTGAGFLTRRTVLHFGHLKREPSGLIFASLIFNLILHFGQITTTVSSSLATRVLTLQDLWGILPGERTTQHRRPHEVLCLSCH